MKQITLLISILILLNMTSCSTGGDNTGTNNATSSAAITLESAAKAVADAEAALYSQNPEEQIVFNQKKAKTVIDAYHTYADNFGDDAKTPEYLFKAAEVHRSLKEFGKAVEIYTRIFEKYPNYPKAPQSLFLLGFSYENDVKNIEEAKKVYSQFLEKYPTHELADDVQFSMSNLGKSPEEIIKEFEAKLKGGTVPTTDPAPKNADAKDATDSTKVESKEAKKEADNTKTEAKKEAAKAVDKAVKEGLKTAKAKDIKPAS